MAAIGVEVVTFATHADGWFDALRASCRRNGLPLTVLGWGGTWTGFTDKIAAMRAHAAARPPDALLLFVDAFDAILLCGPDAIRRRYDAVRGDKPVLIGVDRPWDSVVYWLKRWCFGTTPDGHLLNSGAYCGPAGALTGLLDRWHALAVATGETDDQRLLTQLSQRDADTAAWFAAHVALDVESRVVHNACSTTYWGYLTATADVGLDPVDPRDPRTGWAPCVLHMPGCLNMDPFCDALGLPRGRRGGRSFVRQMLRTQPYYALVVALALFALGAAAFLSLRRLIRR